MKGIGETLRFILVIFGRLDMAGFDVDGSVKITGDEDAELELEDEPVESLLLLVIASISRFRWLDGCRVSLRTGGIGEVLRDSRLLLLESTGNGESERERGGGMVSMGDVRLADGSAGNSSFVWSWSGFVGSVEVEGGCGAGVGF